MGEPISLFPLPKGIGPSKRFRERFNDVAKELGVCLEWGSDVNNPLAVDANELLVDPTCASTYALKSDSKDPTQKIVPKEFSELLVTDVKRVLEKVEIERKAQVAESAKFHTWIKFQPKLDELLPIEREALYMIRDRVMPPLDRIEARQQYPASDQLAEWMAAYGDDPNAEFLFARFRNDFCAGIPYNYQLAGNKVCSLFPFYPDQPEINGMIFDLSLAEFAEATKGLLPTDEILRPTTVLYKDKDDTIKTIPLPLHPAFRADHLELAQAMEDVANLQVDGRSLGEPTRKQLLAWAKFFKSGTAEDEAAAAQASIDAHEGTGNLSLHFGPSESYWNDNTKFPYALAVGLRESKTQLYLKKIFGEVQTIEDSLGNVQNYKPRKISTRGGIAEIVDMVLTGGFLKTFPFGEPAGFNYPNYSGYNTEGSNRFISVERNKGESGKMLKEQNITIHNAIFDEQIGDYDDTKNIVPFIVAHEFGHNMGPSRSHITPSGAAMGSVFGKHWGSADEPKADTTLARAVWLGYKNGRLNKDVTDDTIIGLSLVSFDKLYLGKQKFFDGLTDHAFGRMFEVGYAFKAGVFSLVEVEINGEKVRRIHLDKSRYLEAMSDLFEKIIAFQAAGDLDGYLKFANECVNSIPDEADELALKAKKKAPWLFIERTLPPK